METLRREKGIKILESELDKLNAQIQQTEAEMEKMRYESEIPSYIAQGDGNQASPHTETIRRLESARIDAVAESQQLASLFAQLRKLPGPDLRRAIGIAAPDPRLTSLFDRLAEAEQKWAGLLQTHAREHPDLQSLKKTMDQIEKQISERLEDVMHGLKTKVDASEERIAYLEKALERAKRLDLESPSRFRPYFTAKRKLQTLLAIRDRLQARLIQETVDLALPAALRDAKGVDFDPEAP